MPTERQMSAEQGGFCDPFEIAASMESHNLQQGASVIDAEPGSAGTVKVSRTPGLIRYDEKLTDAVAVYGSKSPGVSVRLVRGNR